MSVAVATGMSRQDRMLKALSVRNAPMFVWRVTENSIKTAVLKAKGRGQWSSVALLPLRDDVCAAESIRTEENIDSPAEE